MASIWGKARNFFGKQDVQFDKLTDLVGALTPEQIWLVREQLESLERRFPEVMFGVCLVSLPPEIQLQEFGFWLLNHAALLNRDPLRPNEKGMILCIDPNSKMVSFSLGYVLERLLQEQDLQDSLLQGGLAFEEENYQIGIYQAMEGIAHKLAHRVQEAKQDPKAFAALQPVSPQLLEPMSAPAPIQNQPPSFEPHTS